MLREKMAVSATFAGWAECRPIDLLESLEAFRTWITGEFRYLFGAA
jgi:hypothetical protein